MQRDHADPVPVVAAYGLMIVPPGRPTSPPSERNKDLILAVVAVIYTLFMIYAGGPKFLVLSFLFCPGHGAVLHRAARAGPAGLQQDRMGHLRGVRGRRRVRLMGLVTGVISI